MFEKSIFSVVATSASSILIRSLKEKKKLCPVTVLVDSQVSDRCPWATCFVPYSADELVVIQENLITINLTKAVQPLKTPIDLRDRAWHQVCLLWVGNNQGQWGVYLDGVEKRGGTQYAQNHKITSR